MTNQLKQFLSQGKILDLIDDKNYTDVYALYDKPNRAELTEFLLSCNIKPDEHMTEIPRSYMFGSNVTEYNISSTVEIIGAGAFGYCNSLTNITIPSKLKTIESSAFYNCTQLKSIELPDSLTSIGYAAFHRCFSIKNLTIPKSVASIGDEAFYDCAINLNINYAGTVKEWRSLLRTGHRIFNGTSYTCTCSDGQVVKKGSLVK
jgi:hypothetical protein